MIKVILVGYMGSGKSFVGQLLSEKTDLLFIDLDQFIEQFEHKSIKSIFDEKGEIYFRKLEHKIFSTLVNNDQSFILSTGGGTPCYCNNHELLIGEGIKSFYLNASVDVLFQRLKKQKAKRPLIANKSDDELIEFIAKHLFERSIFYNKCQFKIDVNNKSGLEIVSEIQGLLA